MNSKPTCSICLCQMINNLMVTECGHVFHEKCISSWMMISSSCPVCKQADIEYTKLFLDLSVISSLQNTVQKYKQLAAAQSKSIASRSHQMNESQLKIKEIKEKNRKLKAKLQNSKNANSHSSDTCSNCEKINPVNIYYEEHIYCSECWKSKDFEEEIADPSHIFDILSQRKVRLKAECQELMMEDIFMMVKEYNLQNRVRSPASKRRKLKHNNVMLTKQMMEMTFME